VEIEAAWVGVIGTLVGTVVGGFMAAYIAYRGQQREPRLLLLDKRIEAHSELYAKLYRIAECIHQQRAGEETKAGIDAFTVSLVNNMLYLNDKTKKPLLEVHRQLMKSIDENKLEIRVFEVTLNDSLQALSEGIGIEYT
jgi:hypothetical protein